jgi:hypothetical protein
MTQKMYGHAHGRQSLHSQPIQQSPFACDIAVLRKYAGYNFT